MINNKKKPIIIALSVLIVITVLFPFYPALIASLESFKNVGSAGFLPHDWKFSNYIEIWGKIDLARYMANGLFYAFSAMFIVLIISIPSAYAISRFKFKGKNIYLLAVLVTQMLSVATIIVPLYLLVLKLGFFDTYIAVIIITSALALPLAIYTLRAYFDTVPSELEEAGLIDGCNRIQTIYYLILPVAAPGIVTTAVITFTLAYRQFFIPLVLLTSQEKYPALIGVYNLTNDLCPEWQYVMTSAIITMLPPLLLYFLLQRYVISGLSKGSVKF